MNTVFGSYPVLMYFWTQGYPTHLTGFSQLNQKTKITHREKLGALKGETQGIRIVSTFVNQKDLLKANKKKSTFDLNYVSLSDVAKK